MAGRDGGGFDRRLIAPMILGSVLNPINSSMLAVALIPIGRAFDVPPAQTAWLVTGLYLATAIGQPVIGRLVDAFGPRPLYLIGTALVGIAGLLGAVAPTLGVLIASRVLLGFGTSAAFPASMALLRSESDRTGRSSPAGVLAALSASAQVIAVVGPTLGGLLIGLGGWKLIFTINVPLSLACLVLGALWLPRRPRGEESAHHRVDAFGIALFSVMLTAFMLFLMRPRVSGWYLVVVALVAGAAFTLRELRTADPFVDLRVLRGNGPLLATYLRQFLAYTTSYAFLYGYTQWLEEGRGLSASSAGLLLLPLSGAAIAVTALTGRHAEVRGKLLVGSFVQVAGVSALLLLHTSSPLWTLIAVAAIIGVPQGLTGLANQNALYAQADPERMGSSAGLLRTFMYLGALAASAANAAVFPHGATTAGLHHMAWLLVATAVLFLVTTLADRSLPNVGRTPETPETPAADEPSAATAEEPARR
ncbi:MFS transporter [Actinomadura rupiterrae]|uniref:MFS transporter n=1 Tax=Actinomadura rupiterrae TaxID=559627 RepID=UPI0020A3F204|nr:MFS transporter [Actinomadura rupiterrae]MCP2341125.1 MFS family permease [Actinomadura rupiterrae]